MLYRRYPFHSPETTAGKQTVAAMNGHIISEFHSNCDKPGVRKSHNFDGRYENIYLGVDLVPHITPVIECALEYARELTGVSDLRAGFWFNAMPPGSTTTLHRHDDDDELLSGVYYIATPADCGSLVIHDREQSHEIEPVAGDFVFFDPATPHEVTRNDSDGERLSIGINFGPLETGDVGDDAAPV